MLLQLPARQRTGILAVAALGAVAALFAFAIPAAPGYRPITAGDAENADVTDIASLSAENGRLKGLLELKLPIAAYIVVDRTNNRLYLRQGDSILMSAVVSSGSGRTLRDEAGNREWTFNTPRGRFEVLRKIQNPIWIRPDWAFIEEGKPIPKKYSDRAESGSLGEYALDFGDGYLIHGTLYERLLGRSVTHGCVRVGRDDLRQLVAAVSVGTPIFVY